MLVQVMGGISGEIDSPFNPARMPTAADDVALADDERILRVKYNVDNTAKVDQVGE